MLFVWEGHLWKGPGLEPPKPPLLHVPGIKSIGSRFFVLRGSLSVAQSSVKLSGLLFAPWSDNDKSNAARPCGELLGMKGGL